MSLVVNKTAGGPFHFGVPPMLAPPMGPPVVPKASSFSPGDTANPQSLSKKKEEYAKALEKNLKEGADQLGVSMKAEIENLHRQAQQEKALHSLLVDQQVKAQELLLSQQYNQQLMLLTQAAQRQGAELEQQATNLMLDYQQRKVEEDFVASQAGVEKQFAEMQQKFADELAKSNVYPVPPIQPPVLGAGLMGAPSLPGAGNLPPSLAPPMLPNMLSGAGKAPMPVLPYVPGMQSSGSRAPSASVKGSSVRAPLPGSFSAPQGIATMQTVAAPSAPQLSFIPGQPMGARPAQPGVSLTVKR